MDTSTMEIETIEAGSDANNPPGPDVEQADTNIEGNALIQPVVASHAALLNDRAQQFIGEINDKRKRDTSLLGEFKHALQVNCVTAYTSMEGVIFKKYEKANKVVEVKLQELFQVIERIDQLESELASFKCAFFGCYSELQGQNHSS